MDETGIVEEDVTRKEGLQETLENREGAECSE